MRQTPNGPAMAAASDPVSWRVMCQIGGAAQLERVFGSLMLHAVNHYRATAALPMQPQGWAGLRLALRRTLQTSRYTGLSDAVCLPGEPGSQPSRAQWLSRPNDDSLIVISPLDTLTPAHIVMDGFGQISCHLDWSQVCTGARPGEVMHMLSRREIGHRVVAAVGVHLVNNQYAHARAASFIELTAENRPLIPLPDSDLFS